MLSFSQSIILGIVLLSLLGLYLVLVYASPYLGGSTTEASRYFIKDYDGVWFRCTREEWLEDRRRSESGEPFSRRSKLLPS